MYIFGLVSSKYNIFYIKKLKPFLHVHAWGEEGEEKRPPVGKDINRPNHSPPLPLRRRASFRVTRHSRVVRVMTSFSRGDVILAWWRPSTTSTRFAWGPRTLGLHAWIFQTHFHAFCVGSTQVRVTRVDCLAKC